VFSEFDGDWFIRGPRWKLYYDGRIADLRTGVESATYAAAEGPVEAQRARSALRAILRAANLPDVRAEGPAPPPEPVQKGHGPPVELTSR
jgi:hypothetical protein